MKIDRALMKKICTSYSPVGREKALREIIETEIKDYVDEITVDKLGNLIARKKGNGKKVMLVANMDQNCMIVTSICEDKTLKFLVIGDLEPQMLLGQRVVFQDGCEGCICSEKNADNANLSLNQLYIYLFNGNKEVGDMFVLKTDYTETDNKVICGCANNHIGCYALVEAVKAGCKTDCDLYYVFTVQEKLGYKGAKIAGYKINPDIGILVGSTPTSGSTKVIATTVNIGDGACIKLKERYMITDGHLKKTLIEIAEKNNIKYQYEILEMIGTGSTAIQFSHDGVLTSGISVPVKNINTTCEIFEKSDVRECIRLICATIECL